MTVRAIFTTRTGRYDARTLSGCIKINFISYTSTPTSLSTDFIVGGKNLKAGTAVDEIKFYVHRSY